MNKLKTSLLRVLMYILISSFIGAMVSSCHNLSCKQCGKKNSGDKGQSSLYPFYHVELQKGTDIKIGSAGTIVKGFDMIDPRLTVNDDGEVYLNAVFIKDKSAKAKYVDALVCEKKAKKFYDKNNTKSGKKFEEKAEWIVHELRGSLYVGSAIDQIPGGSSKVVKRIQRYADPDIPPFDDTLYVDESCISCWRNRDCLNMKTNGWVDKIEVRAMGAYRFGTSESYMYPGSYEGHIEKDLFGFSEGGSDIIVGLETAFLWDVSKHVGIDPMSRNSFHLGFMTGLWPVEGTITADRSMKADGTIFIPLSIHPRFTFNNQTNTEECECNAWYIFGDLGLGLAPGRSLWCNDECEDAYLSHFWNIGIGYDWWLTECMDFSIDMGFRYSKLPLPENPYCSDCIGMNAVRETNQIFLRFGLTW